MSSSSRTPSFFHTKRYKKDQLTHVVTGVYRLNTRTGLLLCAGTVYNVGNQPSSNQGAFRQLSFPSKKLNGSQTYYEILGVSDDATEQELSEAHSRLNASAQSMIDRPDCEEKEEWQTFKKNLTIAFDILKSPACRQAYDEQLQTKDVVEETEPWDRKKHMETAITRFNASPHKIQFEKPLGFTERFDKILTYYQFRRIESFIRKVFSLHGIHASAYKKEGIMLNPAFRALVQNEQERIFAPRLTESEVFHAKNDGICIPRELMPKKNSQTEDADADADEEDEDAEGNAKGDEGAEGDDDAESDEDAEGDDDVEGDEGDDDAEGDEECCLTGFCSALFWITACIIFTLFIAYLQNILTEEMIAQAWGFFWKVMVPESKRLTSSFVDQMYDCMNSFVNNNTKVVKVSKVDYL